jgi:photosystem II stability/assembly factor-like uncharacterized protein
MKVAFRVVQLLAVGLAFGLDVRAEEPETFGGPAEFKALKFRLIGPAVGGRACRAAGVPGDPLTYYVATASGGVWKSTDGGRGWKPIFDDQPVSSIGSIAIAPSDPNVIYVGTGEANIRGNVSPGNGIYKSADGGKTWTHVWNQEGQIGTMVVHPTNPDIAYAAVLGHAFGPNPERGVYRTTDGGKTWQRKLFKDADTGASDVCLDPSNPRIVFAGLWQTRRRPWDLISGGPGSGLYVSRDAGETWKQLVPETPEQASGAASVGKPPPGKGLPEGIWGKIGVAVAPSDSRRVYALIEAENGGLYRSDDGGDTWSLASGDRIVRQRAWYYSTLTVDPRSPDVVWLPQVPMLRSIDGGKTIKRIKGLHHGDNHDIWIDRRNPQRMIVSNDGGLDISTNGGETWFSPPLPIAQFYHVAVDNDTPYHVSGAMQDLGTALGPSNSLHGGGISNGDWRDIGGGEAGHTAHDPTDPNIVYAGEYGGFITRYDHRTGQARNVSVYPYNPSGHGGEDLHYRFQWTAPILVSPHDPQVIYHAANVLFKTHDGGAHWSAISPDLTRNDRAKQKWTGGPITGDNTGVEIYCTIFAIAESPKQRDLLWAGSDDGLVHVSTDGGKHWTNVTANIPGIPQWGTVDCIEPSPFDAQTAYVVVDAHRLDDMKPYIYRTTDLGKTWQSLTEKMPQEACAHVVREDPKKRGLLFAGTERGILYSIDDGAGWRELKLNFPTVPVHDLIVKKDDLVIGTHGRSIWILDDIGPIRQMTAEIAKEDVHLFVPEQAIRYHYTTAFHGEGSGKNPPTGAIIDYFLKEKPKGVITLDILDAQGKLVIQLKSKPEDKKKKAAQAAGAPPNPFAETADADDEDDDDPDAPDERHKKPELTTKPGVNRVTWDLRYEGVQKIKRAKVDQGAPEVGPLVNPGTYTLKLKMGGKTQTAELTVRGDPRVKILAADLDEQLKFALQIRDDMNNLAKMVKEIRSLKKQLTAQHELLKGQAKAEAFAKPAKELYTKLDELEEKLHNPRAKVIYDILAQRGGAKLYSQLASLFEYIKEGDGTPTQGMREVYTEQSSELRRLAGDFDGLVHGELAKLNEAAKTAAIPNIILPATPTESDKKPAKEPERK